MPLFGKLKNVAKWKLFGKVSWAELISLNSIEANPYNCCQLTAAVLDNQSIKSAGHGGPVGHAAGKRIKGRKRHFLVDTLGLVFGAVVIPADTTERDGCKTVLGRLLVWLALLHLLCVDGGYTGEIFAQWVKALRVKLAVEVVKRLDDVQGFRMLLCRAAV